MNRYYHIYSHCDADGGIAAALFSRFILEHFGKRGWRIQVHPVHHDASQMQWPLQEITWPCAILDFTIHPSLLSDRFFLEPFGEEDGSAPPCYWIDHHPTGSSYSFLNEENTFEILKNMKALWDVSAISTPGLMRTHRKALGLSDKLIRDYEEFIDLSEIIDGALFATAESAHDFTSPAVKLQTLFSATHPAIDKKVLYKRLVHQITQDCHVERLFDSDELYASLINYERKRHGEQLHAYRSVCKKIGHVIVADFSSVPERYRGLGRFVPYLLFPDSHYALHVLPERHGHHPLSCGINPWNKPKTAQKHLGNYFASFFNGGGHAFVAGGKVDTTQLQELDTLIKFLTN